MQLHAFSPPAFGAHFDLAEEEIIAVEIGIITADHAGHHVSVSVRRERIGVVRIFDEEVRDPIAGSVSSRLTVDARHQPLSSS
ncbi:hypothetical protein WJ966_25945 [Achromobacter xylosoxidans]